MDSRLVAVTVLALVVGAASGWFLKPAGEPAPDPVQDASDDPAPAPQPDTPSPELGNEVTVLKAELEQVRKDLRDETARREGAEIEISKLRLKNDELRAAAERGTTPDTPTVAKGVRYPYDKYKKPLESIDWDVAGDAIGHIAPLLEELVKARAEGKPIPPSVGNIQRYNGPLVTAALTAQQGGLSGTGANGAFTHPVMLANMIYAALFKSEHPLSKAQEEQLQKLADDYIQKEERRVAGYGEDTLALRKLLDETTLKDRFFAAVDGMLSEQQRTILHPEVVRGRTSADLFSSAVIWGTVAGPQRFSTTEQLIAQLVQQVVARFQVPAEQRSVVDDLAQEWAKGFPPGLLDKPADTLTLQGHMPVERVRIAAERQLAMFKALLDRMPDDWAGATRVRTETFVGVPNKRP